MDELHYQPARFRRWYRGPTRPGPNRLIADVGNWKWRPHAWKPWNRRGSGRLLEDAGLAGFQVPKGFW